MALAITRHLRPRRAVPRRSTWETRTDPTWIESLLTESVRLNQTGRTFTRATSAWDPVHNCIAAPGVARQVYARYRDRVSIPLDLIEGAATNLLPAGLSEHFELNNGGTNNLTFLTGQTAPDGTPTATKFQESTTSNVSHFPAMNITWSNATAYTVSCHFKAAERTWAAIGVSSAVFTGGGTAYFDLVNGVTGSHTAGTTSGIVACGGGWYRCWITFTTTAGATAGVFFYTAISTPTTTYAGTVGSGLYAWGAQIAASAFPTSYISNRNLALHSQDYTNSSWLKTNVTATAASTIDPLSGLNVAQLITETAGGASLAFSSNPTVTSGATFSVSRLVKASSCTWYWMQASNGGVSSGFFAFFNLSTGVTSGGGNLGTGTFVGSTITPVPGFPGWYRLTITGTIGAFTALQLASHSATASGNSTSVNGSTYYLGGTQLEYGSSATAYWGTDATVGGRDADSLTVSLAGLPTGGTSTSAGTIAAILIPYGWSGNTGASARVYDDTATAGVTRGLIATSPSGQFQSAKKDSVAVQSCTAPTPATPANGVVITFGETWQSSTITAYCNGQGGTPVATTPPYVQTTGMQIGSNNGNTVPIYGWVACVYEPRAWTALEHQMVGQYANLALGSV